MFWFWLRLWLWLRLWRDCGVIVVAIQIRWFEDATNMIGTTCRSSTTSTIKKHQHPRVRICYCHHHHHHHHHHRHVCIVLYCTLFCLFPYHRSPLSIITTATTTTTRIQTNWIGLVWFGLVWIELDCIVVVGMTTS